MKKISYLLLLFLAFVYAGCADTEQPYVGYVIIERAVVMPDVLIRSSLM